MGVFTAEEAKVIDNMSPEAQKVGLGTKINTIAGAADVGDVGTLTTTAKSTAVAAINELDADIGNLATLTTTTKTSAVAAMNEINAAKYVKPGTGIPSTDMTAAVQASLGKADTALQAGDLSIPAGTPVNAVAASKVLTISNVVIDGETVTVGADIYEFCADVAQTLSVGTIAVNINASATKARGTLTVDTQPTSGDTMTIGAKTFTFVPNGTANANGEVSRGTDLATAQSAIVAAINGTDGHNTAHPLVTAAAFGANTSIITALVGGVAGNSIATTETFTAVTNIFDGVTLGTTTAGVDCTKGNAKTALIAAVTASDTQGVGATDPGADDITFTADVKGTAGNSIAIAETLANGAWAGAAVFLSGGVNGTTGTQWKMYLDTSYLYVAIAANTINDANWRRIALGSVY